MKPMHLWIVIFLLLQLVISTVGAASLFTPKQSNSNNSNKVSLQLEKIKQNATTLAVLALDLETVKSLRKGEVLDIAISPDNQYQFIVTNISKTPNGNTVAIGKSTNSDMLTLVLTIGKTESYLTVETPQGIISGLGNHESLILYKEPQLPETLTKSANDIYTPPDHNNALQLTTNNPNYSDAISRNTASNNNKKVGIQSGSNVSNTTNTDSTEIATVSVFVVYTTEVSAEIGSDMGLYLDNMIALINQFFADSDVYMEIEIAGTREVEYTNTSLDSALNNLLSQSGPFSNLWQEVYDTGGDTTMLIKPYDSAIDSDGGKAILGHPLYKRSSERLYGAVNLFSTVGTARTFAHEFGHNMGLNHSRAQGSKGIFGYGLGYRVPMVNNTGFATIMAYEVNGAPKISRFSNPDLLCKDLKCGVNNEDSELAVDAAKALNQVRFGAENILHKDTVYTPFDEALAGLADDNLKQCLLDYAGDGIAYAEQVWELSCYAKNISDLTGIEVFKNIAFLNLGRNLITDANPVWSLTNLEYLWLDGNNISVVTGISALNRLELLVIDDNDITDFSPFLPMANLLYFDFSYNPITSMTSLASMESLITVTGNGINVDSLDFLAENPNLTEISFRYTNISSLPSPFPWPFLRRLDLRHNNLVSLDGLEEAHDLISLAVDDNQITSLAPLSNLQNLESLSVTYNALTNLNGVPTSDSLKYLGADQNQINDFSALSEVDSLVNLSLSGNSISDITSLSGLANLEYLHIYDNQISDISSLSSLTKLVTLGLSNNNISDISVLAGLVDLRGVGLKDNPISDISSLFGNLFIDNMSLENTPVACWQQEYLVSIDISLTTSASCSTTGDDEDFDNDGVSNREELSSSGNPVNNDSVPTEVAWLSEEVTVMEMDLNPSNESNKYTLYLRRSGALDSESQISINVVFGENASSDDISYSEAEYEAVLFAPGEYLKSIELNITRDSEAEAPEFYYLNITDPIDTAIGDAPQLTVQVIDEPLTDRPAPSFELTEPLYIAENSGAYELVLNRTSGIHVELSMSLVLETEPYVEDTVATINTTQVQFAEGQATTSVFIQPIDNSEIEDNKTIYLHGYTTFAGYLIEEYVQAIVFTEDDGQKGVIEFSDTDMSFNESSGNINIVLTRIEGSYGELTVSINLSGSATNGSDYSLSSTSVVFGDGETQKQITLSVTDDATDENDETITLQLSAVDSSIIGNNSQLNITVVDNDTSPVTPPSTGGSSNGKSSGGGSLHYLLAMMLVMLVSRILAASRKAQPINR